MFGRQVTAKSILTRRFTVAVSAVAVAFAIAGCSDKRQDPTKVVPPQKEIVQVAGGDQIEAVANSQTADSVGESRLAFAYASDPTGDFSEAFQPASEGWQSEAFYLEVQKQLKLLAKMMEQRMRQEEKNMEQSLKKLVSLHYRGTVLKPKNLDVSYRDETYTVRVANGPFDESLPGVSGFDDSLAKWIPRLVDPTDVHVKFKVVGVQWNPNRPATKVLYQGNARAESGIVQQNATWDIGWSADETPPQIVSVHISEFREITSQTPTPQFVDHSERILAGNTVFYDQLEPGIDYWRDRIPQFMGIYYFGHHGLAVGDANGDGYDDLFVCQPGGLPNRLFLRQPDGTAVDVSQRSGVDVLNNSRSALLLDLDNDGDNDLVVCATDRLLVYANDGNANFTLTFQGSDIRGGYTISSVDFDHDSLLDLYVTVYLNQVANEGRLPYPVPYHDANNGGRNILLKNTGALDFQDVTQRVGLEKNNRRFSYAGVWDDFDLDGDMDLYVANDFGHNCLYRNDDGKFNEVASAIGLEDTGFGMSATWGDYNRDGWMDLYVGNMYSGAGNRIAYQSNFQKDASQEIRRKLQRSARGNSLFQNQGDGTFRDVSLASQTTMGRWSWGTLFYDANNDGWQEIVALNGMVTGTSSADL